MEYSDFVGTAECNALINGEGAELHSLVVDAHEDQFTTTQSFTISSGSTYALSGLPGTAPFYKLRGLDRDEGGGDWREVQRFGFDDRNRRASTGWGPYGRTVRYRLVGASLRITPDDAATGTYRLWYVPGWVDLASDSDTIDYPENWYEYVVAGVAAKLVAKEEGDVRTHLELKDRIRARIQSAVLHRDAAGPERMTRVRNRRGWDSPDYED
jgi:hypothetical protein